jgi:hypothetical protein
MKRRTVLWVTGLVLPAVLFSAGCDDKKAEIPTNKNMELPKSFSGGPQGKGAGQGGQGAEKAQ